MLSLLFFLAGGPMAMAQVLVAPGSDWHYLDQGATPANWTAASFDDSAWPSGPAQLGYGDGDEQFSIGFGPDPQHRRTVHYFRRSFDAPVVQSDDALYCRVLADDGAVVYLNGVEIHRHNLPAGNLDPSTLALSSVYQSSERRWEESWTAADLLQPSGNQLAVAVYQVGPMSTDLSFDLSLEMDLPPRILRGPYLQMGTASGLEVRWRTPLPEGGEVHFGTKADQLDQISTHQGQTRDHQVTLTGLQASTTYYYTISNGLHNLTPDRPVFSFTTPAPPGSDQSFRAWVLGDGGTANLNAMGVREAFRNFATSKPADLILMLGDNAYESGTDREYQRSFYDFLESFLANTVVWSTRGNHETQAQTYYGMFSFPTAAEAGGLASGTEAYYSFDWGNVHFVCLDSHGSDSNPGSPMLQWLEQDLASTDQTWTIAFWHHPPYTKASHDSDNPLDSAGRMMRMRANALPVLEAGGVDLVLSGHSHSYERTFLIHGHYGLSATFAEEMKLDGGSGQPEGTGAYQIAPGPHAGAVYCVAGSSGMAAGGPLNHPAMYTSLNLMGSVVLDFSGPRLDVSFLGRDGEVHDHFSLINGPSPAEPAAPGGDPAHNHAKKSAR
jgi:calcineurin-like phosphoesterase family protein/purple acid phosphatase-like protein